MSNIVAHWAAHLALASVAICAIACVAAIVMRIVRDDAVAVHRAARFFVLACLGLLPLQLLAATRDLRTPVMSAQRDFVARLVSVKEEEDSVARFAPPSHEAPVAASPALGSNAVVMPPAPILEKSPSSRFELDARIVALLVFVHALGLLIWLAIQFRRVRRTRSFLARVDASDSEILRAAIESAAEHSHLTRYSVRVSSEIDTPCCAGVLNPVIVIPAADLQPGIAASRTALALLHEMIHLERRDPLVQIAERAFITLFWFHPIAWWLVRTLSDARELACDQEVAERTRRRRSYARVLLDYAVQRSSLSLPATNSGVTNTTALLHWVHWIHWKRRHCLLRRRIEMLTSMPALVSTNRRSRKNRRITFALAGGSVITALFIAHAFVASALPAFAKERETKVAFCPPKQAAPIVLPPQCEQGAPDTKKPTDALKQPRDATKPQSGKKKSDVLQLSPEERSKRLQELLASKRGADAGARALLVSSGNFVNGGGNGGMNGDPQPMDPEVKHALIQTLLNDQHDTTRATAASALAPFIREREVKDAFMRALRDSNNQQLKVTVLDELLKREALSDDARELFVRLFAMDNDEFNRITMTEALAPYANDPDARDALVEALVNDSNESMQVNAARALASQAADSTVQSAMTRMLRGSRNEVARMAIIDALASEVAGSQEIQTVFIEMLLRDDNPVARLHVAEKLAGGASEPKVRRVMIKALEGGVSVVLQRSMIDALSAYVREPDVKRSFIQLLDRIENEVIRMRIVESLAGIATSLPTAGRPDPFAPTSGSTPMFPRAAEGNADVVPIVNSKS